VPTDLDCFFGRGMTASVPSGLKMHHPLRVLLAPDKFKGTLTAAEVADALRAGIAARSPRSQISIIPVADGGDGSLDVALSRQFQRREVPTAGPLGDGRWGAIAVRDESAVIELACLCGLQALAGAKPEPLKATSLGLGLAMRAALDAGFRHLIIGLGGSASTDGGLGLLSALGAQLRDEESEALDPLATNLQQASRVDLDRLDPRLASTRIEMAVDVAAPLLGPQGTAAVFAPQKGATPENVAVLEASLTHWRDLLIAAAPHADAEAPGAGAAGGVGFAGTAFGARLVSGADLFLDLAEFDAAATASDLVITGEGRLDKQTLMGKAPAAIAARCTRIGVPLVAVVGSMSRNLDPGQLQVAGFDQVHTLVEVTPDAATDADASRAALMSIAALVVSNHLAQITHKAANP